MKYFSDDYFAQLKEMVVQYTLNNYDYCYLKAMHEKNRTVGTETIIAGSSHAMNGIVEKAFSGDCINFSISSQDIYYDFRHIKKAVEESRKKIKKCIINIGYYMLYQDLSYSKVISCLIPSVYYPLFGDPHHFVIDTEYDMLENVTFDKKIYSEELAKKICEEWANGFFLEDASFYGKLKSRENHNNYGLKKIIWNTLSEEEKEYAAIERTNDHNRLKQHTHSRMENGKLVEEMAEYLHEYDIVPLFVIFPFTMWYNQYIDKDYKTDIYNLLESVPFPVGFLDMNDYTGIFDDSDFLDTDHLNRQGALKATALLNEYMQSFYQNE